MVVDPVLTGMRPSFIKRPVKLTQPPVGVKVVVTVHSLLLACILSGCCVGSDAWVIEPIDSSRPWANAPPRIAVAKGVIFVSVFDLNDDKFTLLS